MTALVFVLLVLLAGAPQDGAREERISDGSGLDITARYYQPPFGGAPTIVIVHDWGARYQRWEDIAPRFQSLGFGVILFNLRGHGTRSNPWYLFTDDDVRDLKRDVSLVSDYAARLSPGMVYIIGEGLGANLAMAVAADNAAIRKVVALSPGLAYRGVYLSGEILAKVSGRVLLIASRDDTYSANCLREINAMLPEEPASTLYSNAGHGVWMLKRVPDAIPAIARWLGGEKR